MLGATEFSLELYNVFHTGQVEPGTCFQRMIGSVKTGVILKDVSLEVHGGEVLAILGSKGSGKRALLEVISRRAQGPTRGQILLNGAPMSLKLFQKSCAYVTHKCDLLPGLSVEQTLLYAAHLAISSKVSRYVRHSRARQVMADLALSQVANRSTDDLTQSEYRRLMIGVQLVRDPVVLLLDEPTWDLDPLSTYLVVSMLSHHARRYNRIVVLSMEQPRSDVFPFLDRVAYLCLGDVVYTGPTRLMLHYFRDMGFPCPELENPLMYYLCLSTVDRRSRERFIESNLQIGALVERFKVEGGPFRKSPAVPPEGLMMEVPDPLHANATGVPNKVPLAAFGRPGTLQVALALYLRCLAATLSLRRAGFYQLSLRLLAQPLLHLLLWVFYTGMQDLQSSFVSRNGLVFNCVAVTYGASIFTTSVCYAPYRTRYYQQAQEGLYSGPLFLLTYLLVSLPLSLLSLAAASRISFQLTGLETISDWLLFWAVLWACHLLAEQQTMAILAVVCSSFSAALTSLYITTVCLLVGSGALRSYSALSDWLVYVTYATQPRYASAFLSHQTFGPGRLQNLPPTPTSNCSMAGACEYADGMAFFSKRWGRDDDSTLAEATNLELNVGAAFAFPASMILLNCLIYLIPLPAFVKAKFRE